jgi:hypothetical protein
MKVNQVLSGGCNSVCVGRIKERMWEGESGGNIRYACMKMED